jgi:hypothetical protein
MSVNKIVDFKPELAEFAGSDGRRVMDDWGIPSRGAAVYVPGGQLGAVWHGTKFNQRAETPALFVSVDVAKRDAFAEKGRYFIGVLLRPMIEEAEDPNEEVVKAAFIQAHLHRAEDPNGTPLKAALESIEEYFAATLKPDDGDGLLVVKSELLNKAD